MQRTQDNLQIVGSKAVRPISGANLGFEGAAGTIADYIGIILELPSRLLMTGDELLKQLNYRGRLYTNALDNTMERGLSLYSKEGRNNIKRDINSILMMFYFFLFPSHKAQNTKSWFLWNDKKSIYSKTGMKV